MKSKMESVFVACLGIAVILSGCGVPRDEPSDKLLAARYYLGGETGLTPEQVDRAQRELLRQRQERENSPEPQASPMVASHTAPSISEPNFPSPPGDKQSDCDDPNSEFVQWINSVQQKASSGGACLNAKGVQLINSEGAKKSRFCAQFYTGSERQASLDQADEYDRTASQARRNVAETCS